MELLLNLCWLGLTSVAFGLWLAGRRRGASPDPRRAVALEFLALAAAALLLFPVISLSDDLQAEPVMAEGRALSAPTAKNWGNDRIRLIPARAATPALAAFALSFTASCLVGCAPDGHSLTPRPGFVRWSDVRGPPSFRF